MSEYWIQQDGSVEFADGDVGDYNHEGIVIDWITKQIVEKCENTFDVKKTTHGRQRPFSYEDHIDIREFEEALLMTYKENLVNQYPIKKPNIEQAFEENPDKYLEQALKQAGVGQREWNVVSGHEDARNYAMQKWGWKTYRDGHIDTWFWRKPDLTAIVEGIENIAHESGWSDKKLAKQSFTINIFSNKKSFTTSFNTLKNPPTTQSNYLQKANLDYLTPQANKQIRDMEISNLHPAYRRPGVNPLGDHTQHTFKKFFIENHHV
jgi:hypothetical protein